MFFGAPILDGKLDPGALDGAEIIRVAGRQRPVQTRRDRGDKAIRELDSRALLRRRCLDAGGAPVIGGDRRDLFVLVQPASTLLNWFDAPLSSRPYMISKTVTLVNVKTPWSLA